MKRLLIGGLAVGSMLLGVSGVAAANTVSPLATPAVINLDKTVLTSTVSGDSWPLAANPGTMMVSFATPSSPQAVSGYAVTCKAPTKDTLGAPISLPNLVATFAVNPATGTSADPDFNPAGSPHDANPSTITSLQVGPYSVVNGTHLPPLQCTIVASNAGGSSKAGKPNTATAPAPSGDCSVDTATVGTGLESQLGAGSLLPVTGDNNDDPIATTFLGTGATPATTPPLGKQTAKNFDFVLADLSGFGGPSAVPFCSTNEQYLPHLLADQPVAFSPVLSAIPQVFPFKSVGVPACTSLVTGPATATCKANAPATVHPAQVKFAALGLTATVKSTATLTVSSSNTLFAYDSVHFAPDACTTVAGAFCITNSALIVAGGAPTPPPGVSYFAVSDSNSHIILPGKPIVGAPISITFHKTGVTAGMPLALGISFGGAQTTISVGAAPPVPVQVAPPGSVILGLTSGATDGGDLNYKSAIAIAPVGLF